MTTQPLKICIIPAWYPTLKNKVDGVFIQDQAEALAAYGHHTSVLFITNTKLPSSFKGINYQIENGVHSFTKTNLAMPKLSPKLIDLWAMQYYKLWEKYVDDFGYPDIIHSHSYLGGFAAQLLAKKNNIPHIHTEHSTNFISGDIKNRHRKKIHSLFSKVDGLVSVGQQLKDKMVAYCKRTIDVIPNLINDKVFYFDNKEIKENYFLIVGGLDKRKNIPEIIECFSKIDNKEIQLIIIGTGKEERKILQLINTLNLSERISLLGNLSPENVALYMKKATALISNSDTETFGKVIIESLACGTPVICRNAADPEVIVIPKFGSRYQSKVELQELLSKYSNKIIGFSSENISTDILAQYGRATVVAKIQTLYSQVLKNKHAE